MRERASAPTKPTGAHPLKLLLHDLCRAVVLKETLPADSLLALLSNAELLPA